MGLNVKLIIVGDGETRQALEKTVQDLELNQHVILAGYRPNPANYFQAFDVYMLTSFSEGTSMTLLEAMSLSKPCIVTGVGGNAEVIKHQLNGIIVNSDDDNALADSIKILLQNPKLIKLMGKEGKKRFEQLFTDTEMASQYVALYQAVSL